MPTRNEDVANAVAGKDQVAEGGLRQDARMMALAHGMERSTMASKSALRPQFRRNRKPSRPGRRAPTVRREQAI